MPLIPIKPHKAPPISAAAQTSQLANTPPPTGGLNLRDPISEMSPLDAVVLENLIPRQQGLEMRKGFQTFVDYDVSIGQYKSVFGYNAANPADSKLFAAAGGDIYDITSGTPAVAAASTGSTDDLWWTVQFANSAGMYLLAVSPDAGYWVYDGANWTKKDSSVTNMPSLPRTVSVWKQRVWFTCKESSDVYYLQDVDAIQGTAVLFPMGSVLRNGGSISALVNWTIDSGFSLDDYLVAIGTEGDIGVWTGTDPSSADTFGLKGIWYIGPVPRYGTYFTPFGGDVMILSVQGLIPMSKLVSGQYNEAASNQMPASKIQPVLGPLIAALQDQETWNVFLVPNESILVIQVPQNQYGVYVQYVMNTITGAWCSFTNMNMVATGMFGNQLYYADNSGQIIKGLFGNYDNSDSSGLNGYAIEADVQTAFNAFGTPAQLKKFQMVRPIFLAPNAPSVKLQLNTQYSVANVSGAPAFNDPTSGVWDTSNWNSAYFAGAANTYQAWVGVFGLGYYGSVRMKVRGFPGTIFTSMHVMTELGGVM